MFVMWDDAACSEEVKYRLYMLDAMTGYAGFVGSDTKEDRELRRLGWITKVPGNPWCSRISRKGRAALKRYRERRIEALSCGGAAGGSEQESGREPMRVQRITVTMDVSLKQCIGKMTLDRLVEVERGELRHALHLHGYTIEREEFKVEEVLV